MKYLYRLYQLVICLPILLVASVLTSLSTVLGCMLGNGHFWGYYPGKYWSWLWVRILLLPVKVEKIKELASQVPDSIRNRFANLVDKWNIAIDHNPKTRYSASTYSYAKLPEFIPLKSMGKQIVPLIMERMINPFLVLYKAVLEGYETNDDSKFSESEQIRAIRCVKKWLEKQ